MAAKKKDMTFEKAVPSFLQHLKDEGKNERTVEVYGRCLETAVQYFGADKTLATLNPPVIGMYYKSDELLKKPNGKAKSEITVTQTKRVLKQLLVWAQGKGFIATIPLPKSEMKGGRTHNAQPATAPESSDSAVSDSAADTITDASQGN